jgi:hypothetical protein
MEIRSIATGRLKKKPAEDQNLNLLAPVKKNKG